jgi:very-short-patch-repair endonuclease
MLNLRNIVIGLGGAATRQQLIAAGATGNEITSAVRSGQIMRIRQARYVVDETALEIQTAVRVGGMLAGPSAARTYGLWGGFTRVVHVAIAPNAARLHLETASVRANTSRQSDLALLPIELHWSDAGRVRERGPECWRVPLPVCLTQSVRWLEREDALACLDTALTVHRVSRATLQRIFRAEPARSRLLASLARRGSESGVESIVRRRLEALGVTVEQQLRVPGVGRVDMRVVGTPLLIEVDGRTYHQDPASFENDRRRDAELTARGFVVVRLSFMRVATDWPWCERMVLAAISSFRK